MFASLGRWLVLASVGCSICSCASASGNADAVARGEALAARSCAGCHGMGLAGASSFPDAPAFRDMHFDENAIGYERSLAKMHMGYVNMPPPDISLDQVADIGAYVRSLKSRSQR